jgi:hypothetical protein
MINDLLVATSSTTSAVDVAVGYRILEYMASDDYYY